MHTEGFWLVQVCLSKLQLGFLMSLCLSLSQQWDPPGSPTIEPPFIQLATDGVSWNCRSLCLKVSLSLFGSWSRCFLHHSNNPSLQSSIKFSLVATSREVGYSAVDLKLPDTITYGGHRDIKVFGDGLVALRLSMFDYNLVSDVLRQFSVFLSLLSFLK